jgi:hypothetical protein
MKKEINREINKEMTKSKQRKQVKYIELLQCTILAIVVGHFYRK